VLDFAGNFLESIQKPDSRLVFFRSLRWNRKVLLWYANKVVRPDSVLETAPALQKLDQLRREGTRLTFISNHLTYADSHIIETLWIRYGFQDLANHLIHIAGQKTYEFTRRFFTRSLHTIRVYQPKARIDKSLKRKMNARALRWAAHLKRRGFSILVFPEGTRTRAQKRFNRHAANPKTTVYFKKSLVVPMGLMGAEKIMPVGQILQRPATVVLRIGEPIDHDRLESSVKLQHPGAPEQELRVRLMDHYMQQIEALLAPEYRNP
jgi:1-acyl-sn-glycerol-3-phosphate acyltransferase